jgi:hypothetical protein
VVFVILFKILDIWGTLRCGSSPSIDVRSMPKDHSNTNRSWLIEGCSWPKDWQLLGRTRAVPANSALDDLGWIQLAC